MQKIPFRENAYVNDYMILCVTEIISQIPS